MKWIARPTRAPHQCLVSRRGKDEPGPFLDLDLDYFPHIRDENGGLKVVPRLSRAYICARVIKEVCQKPDSPLAVMEPDELAELEMRANRYEDEAADLAAQLEEARAEIELLKERQAAPIDFEALGSFFDARYAKKTGPKAKA